MFHDTNHRFRPTFPVFVVILRTISVRLRNPLRSYLGICRVDHIVAAVVQPEARSVAQAKLHEARPCKYKLLLASITILIIGFDKLFLFLLSFYTLYQLDLEIHNLVI